MEEGSRGFGAAVLAIVLVLVIVVGTGWMVRLALRPDVAIVGDSILAVAAHELESRLSGDYDLKMAAALGITIDGMQAEAERKAKGRPRHAVIELGSNDVLHGKPLDQSAVNLRTMVDAFRNAGVDCVHVVNVSTRMVNLQQELTTLRAEQLNATMAALDAERPDVVIIDWNQAVLDAEQRGGSLTGDTVHPNSEGSKTLARLIDESLARGCAR